MIAKLTGLLDSIGEDHAVVDVGGVGYLLYCPGRTLARLPGLGEAASFFVITHVREDHIHLYGFTDEPERDWFRLLTTVQGVGARVALAILTVLGPAELVQAIAAQDRPALTRAEGVGPKVATRILGELKDKAGGLALGPVAAVGGAATGAAADGPPHDAVSALTNLGYGRTEAYGSVSQAVRRLGAEASTEALIREGLTELGR